MSGLISVADAFDALARNALPVRVETVSIDEAHGRQLIEAVAARVSRPPADMSAMDGYAVRLEDVRSAGARLTVIGEAPAGAPFEQTLGEGEAVRIFTGGEIPAGADHIVIQEDTARTGDEVLCSEGYEASRFIRKAGRDFHEGDRLLDEGAILGAGELGLLAAGNIAEVNVRRRLRVGILANGNELKPPGTHLKRGEIVNSNPVALADLIRSWGAEPVDLGIAADTLDAIAQRIENARDIDVFLPVGGASVGDHDLMRPAFAEAGFESLFEKIAVRPGKPTWFSTRGDTRVLGLPGNPASALVCAQLFLKPLITGQRHSLTKAALACDLETNGPREHYMRAFASFTDDGRLTVDPAPDQDSSLIKPFVTSAALLRRLPNAPAKKRGELEDIILTSLPRL
ncbi:molybdopterin molybdenumtransferase MoeA [Henriciella barbarensis]|uniref:Molybdopterin molybdenumtransferase n=1 Tax=Henriciella barbarensis TaxID=86342 RepID=A0A399R0V2_9PROT|nr:molybdopterin molybdotransferase MoeA [Henriciella barbarensis]RIJ24563.1 molybdopterin molybdenumtransferase MoeA [Henriciella barbarensis]